ncbi:T9SS type A sorting domain-containing protein [Runella limosa]|uniref:T9SS type A sorting domain-containing protein n=1 Tax=Runella limosa TaxID=370978 RepID=UPI00041B6A9B|nr:T9SS type A sorting domain-containing protein [Runella limosa]
MKLHYLPSLFKYCKIPFLLGAFLLLGMSISQPLLAQKIWTGGAGTADWNTANNWNPVGVPTVTDEVEIQTVTTGLFYPIISTADAKAKSVIVNSSTTLRIASTGQLTINGSRSYISTGSVFVLGTLENNGKLALGNENTLGNYGLFNSGVLNNNAGAEISIDRTAVAGLSNDRTGVVTNAGKILLGATQTVGESGLSNFGTVDNKAGGLLQIDRCSTVGLSNNISSMFTNEGVVKVGSVESVGFRGIYQAGNFDNKLGGQITVDRFSDSGILQEGGTTRNYANITIGAIAGGGFAVNSNAAFSNEGCSALLSVQSNSIIIALPLNNSGVIIEKASNNSTIGSNTGLVQNLNGGTFNVGTGPNPVLSVIPVTPTTFNGGDGAINIKGVLNGTYEATYTKDGGSPITTNLTATANELTIPALGAGSFAITVKATSCSTLEFSLSTTIENPTLTLNSVSQPVTCTAKGNIVFASTGYKSSTQTVSYRYQATSSATAETRTASVNIHSDGVFNLANLPIGIYSEFAIGNISATGSRLVNVNVSATELVWTGCANADWHNAANWNRLAVPTATDDVEIWPTTDGKPYPIISTTDAKAKWVSVLVNATLTIANTGQLTINSSRSNPFRNSVHLLGTLENNGKLVLGNESTLTDYGLSNFGVLNNKAGAEISIDRTTGTALYNLGTGVMTNAGKILLGATQTIGESGLSNSGTFDNKAGGLLQIDRSSGVGLSSQNGATFTNEGVVKVGSLESVGFRGIYQAGNFDNKLGGQITVDRFTNFGINQEGGTIKNYASITIGAIAGGTAAVSSNSTFLNEGCSALLSVQSNSVISTLSLSNSGVIIEKGTGNSTIGSNTGLVQNLNGGVFNVGTGPNPVLSAIPRSPTTFNGGDGSINIQGLLNGTYEVTYIKDGGSPTTTNLTATTNELTIPALGVGSFAITVKATSCSTLEFSLSATIVNSTLTLQATNRPVSCTGTGSISFGSTGYGSSTQTVNYSYQASSSATAETRTASVNIGSDGGFTLANLPIGIYSQFAIGSVVATGSRAINVKFSNTALIWTGCANADWHNAANWNTLAVPTATDEVEIQETTDSKPYPIISTTDTRAKSVYVYANTTLTIANTGQLTINGARSSGVSASVLVAGTLVNNGKLVLGNEGPLGVYGLISLGVFNNNAGAELMIDRSRESALTNNPNAVMTNAGTIRIGQTQSIGLVGCENFGTFDNKVGGMIQIDRASSVGLTNRINSTFTNEGVVKIGSVENIGGTGIGQNGSFDNKQGGEITIDRFLTVGIYNQVGTFRNYASIIIGAIAGGTSGVINTGTFSNEGCGSLLSVQSNSTITTSGTTTNAGIIIENASGTSGITTNTGLVQNLNGGTFTIQQSALSLPVLSAVGIPPSNCPTNNNGSVSVVGVEANTEYIVVLGAGGTPQTLTSNANGQLSVGNLSVGTYTFTLKKGCWSQAISVTATIAAPTLTNGSSTIGATCTTAGRIVFDTNLGFTSTPTTYPATFKRNGVSQSGQLSINNSSGTINSIILVSEEGYYSDIKVQYGTCEVTYVGTVYVAGAVSSPTITPPTACATTNGSVRFATSVDAGTYTLNYKKNGESATASITVVAAGRAKSFTLSDLGVGVYTDFSLTAGSCTITYSPIIRVGDLPNPSVSGTTAVTTLGGTDGNIKLSGLAVSKSYSISYQKDGATATTTTASSDADGNLTIPNLGGGNYTNIILTISGCSSSPLSATVNAPTAPVVYSFAYSSTVAPSGCGTTDGALVFTTNLPVGTNAYTLDYTSFGSPYMATISVTAASGGGNTFTLSGLGAGSYRDFSIMYNGNRLSLEGIYNLSNPDKPTFAVGTKTSPTSCNATDGSIQLTGLVASTNYGISYQKDGGTAVTVTVGSDASGNLVIVGLGAGAYTNIKVTLKGCQSVAATATISAPTFTMTQTSSSNPTTCGATDGSISFSTSLPTGTYTLAYKKNGEVQSAPILIGTPRGRVSAVGNTFTLTDLGAGSYSDFKIMYNGCEVTLAGPYTLSAPSLATATISGTVTVCQNAPAATITFMGANGTGSYTFGYKINGGILQSVSTSSGSNTATLTQPTTTVGVFSYELVSVADANCSQTQTGSAAVTVQGKPTITLSALQQTLVEGNNPVLCDTDANPVNSLQFNISGLCVVGSPVWRVQVGSGAWSDWSTSSPVTQSSNNQLHRYQAACDGNCASTYSGVITLTITGRASVPQNVSLLVDGVTVAVGETKEVCSLANNTIIFNANCAAGEVTLYSVDGGEYSSGVPTGLVDNQYHNYRVRCRKSDGTPSCVESESGVMRLKLVAIPNAPTVSLSSSTSCDAAASFSGQSSCGSLRTVWYNATTNMVLPNLPTNAPSATTSYYARCQTENGCVSEKSNVVTFTPTSTQAAPVITVSQEIVCTGTTVRVSANCPSGSQTFWNTGVTTPSFEVAFNNVTKQTYWAKCVFAGGCQSAESARKDIYWNAFVVTLINVGETKSSVKTNDRNAWSSQFITRDGGPELEQSTQVTPTLYYVENANKVAPRYWTINVETCGLGTNGSVTFDMQAVPEMGVIRSFNTHENNAPYFMYANREGWTELYAQNHPAYGFYQDNGAGGNVYDSGLPKGLYKLGIRYWDMKGWGSIFPSTRKPQGNVLAYQEYWFRIQSKDGVGVGAARTADSDLSPWRFADAKGLKPADNIFAQVMPNPVSSVLRLQVQDSKGKVVQTTLTDASGRQVLRRDFVPETNSHLEEFEVSELASGMYFLQVNAAGKQQVLKVVKVK